ncbi:GumC family protein [Thioalkalivibrio sp.]|uniref:GumC family protein n=1 Tax=Thioalkalivibrio sp. TaxID=2093813 RepID=UPI003562CB98
MASGDERDAKTHPLRAVPGGDGPMIPYEPARTAPPIPPDDDDSIDLREYWKILVKRKWLIIALLAIVVTATFMVTKLQVPEYRATALVLIEPEAAQVLAFADLEQTSGRGSAEYRASQYEILRSRALATAVVEAEQLQDHPELTGEMRQRSLTGELRALTGLLLSSVFPASERGGEAESGAERSGRDATFAAASRLQRLIEIEPVRNTHVVRVRAVSFDPEFSARLANAVVREYIDTSMQRRFDSGTQARRFLEGQLDEMRIALERSDRALAQFAREARVSDLEANIELTREGLRSNTERLEEVRRERLRLEGWDQLARQGQVEHLEPVAGNERLTELQARLQDARIEYRNLSEQYTDSFPMMAERGREVEALREEVSAEQARVVGSISGRLESLRAEEASLEGAIERREEQLMALSERSVQYNILRREYETNRELHDALLQRMKEVGVAAGVQKSNISVIDEASVPGGAFRPVLQKNLAIASMLGLMIGIGLALLLEFLDSTIRRTEDIERLVDRPVLGLIPLVRARGKRANATKGRPDRALSHYSVTQPKSAVSEAFRSLRTSLMFSTPDGMPGVLLFTSSSQGEGKSTSAINLATVLAQNGASVLLIDADLRRPTLHRDFGIPRAPGLTDSISQVSRGQQPEHPLIHGTDLEGLSVMPAGHATPSPAELLSSRQLAKVINDCRRIFDHVIVDAPPILGLADAVVASRMVDGVVLVAAAGQTGKENFRVSVQRLRQVQAPLIGVVLNRVDLESPEYSYYSAYYYNYEPDKSHREPEEVPHRKAS